MIAAEEGGPDRERTGEPAFVRIPDSRCQRGLQFLYRPRKALDTDVVSARLQRAFDHKLVQADEPWGARMVRRLVLQFRFEVRIGSRDGELSFLHRISASADQRIRDARIFEEVLRLAVGGE